jgi:hypothetical protein
MLFREIIVVYSKIRSSYCWNYRVLLGLSVFVNFVYSYVCYLAVYVPVFSARMRAMAERLLGSSSSRCVNQQSKSVVTLSLAVLIQYCKVYGMVFRCRITADRYVKRLVINTSYECDVP